MTLKWISVLIKNCGCINMTAVWNQGEHQISIYETHLEVIALFFKAFVKDTLQNSEM